MVGYLTGLNRETTSWAVLALVAGGILIFCFKDAKFRKSRPNLIAGFGIGLCVVAGWFLTGLALDPFDPTQRPISLTYVRPTGDTLEYLMRYTALGPPGFGVVTLLGAMLGGFLGAASMKRLHLITFADKNDSWRNMVGAALMGVGGVLALGCTVGQAMTGFSTLAMGSIITFFFIVMGGIGGMKIMERLA
ncbi:MAG: YeeE/YedE family protein [Alphaproteobacteria bacterium]|nr:YeeE/YedE family protein [Alphaproteobacteria bacterium]